MTSAQSGTTGRYLVLLEDDWSGATRELNRVAGIRAVDSAQAGLAQPLWEAEGLVLRELGVALVSANPDQLTSLTAAVDQPGPIALVEPERYVQAIAAPTEKATEVDETTFTWGLQAVGAPHSAVTGAGVRVAVLDTGLDLTHPDLAGRTITSKSFVEGEEVQDGHGHGTHCVGTSCGPRRPASGPGYGVAYEAEIYAGKVLSNAGSGADGGILAGIAWAIQNGCRVVSMSLGAAVRPGQPYSRTYERVASRALARGTLIIAAAGNESDRAHGGIAPVGHPANCPSILAVGAVDVREKIADFSSATVDAVGAVDIVGPGVDVYSSWPLPTRYRRISGTSMATPHAAGIAALIAQSTGASGYELWARLAQTARRLKLPSTDVGSGMVQAP
ncbi:MAG TPA: S8 family serine peptidase [Actinophytocola sp.]|jgi:subtilisin family serine protease|uniref:S8 family peptidase n=1 Tax=Actinophytocola sp. TaxID=1872138 RepID=UPI002F9480D1